MDHVAAHIDAADSSKAYRCPCFPITCQYQQEMPLHELVRYLVGVYSIVMPKTTRKEKKESKKKARALGEDSVYAQGESGEAESSKRMRR